MRRVVVLSTGGTIASRPDSRGAAIAADDANALLAQLPGDLRVPVEGVDVLRVGSYLLTPGDMAEIVRSAHEALADPDVLGVVVTHGTDTLEETAFLADLVHHDRRPVVFTGAQRAPSAGDTDGPRNLTDAITVAACPEAAGHGVLIVFDGQLFAARGTRKTHTLAPAAFSAPDGGPLGRVRNGSVRMAARLLRSAPLGPEALDLDGVRVDIVAGYPGTDATALDAVAAAGARGVVLEATGAGNANPAVRTAIARLTGEGVVVALSTRVHAGPVTALYGGGGGVDLIEAGAVPVGTLRSPQARVLLLALLARDRDPRRVAAALRRMAEAGAADTEVDTDTDHGPRPTSASTDPARTVVSAQPCERKN
ncbi:asparaginase [Streptomyces tubercidicus]